METSSKKGAPHSTTDQTDDVRLNKVAQFVSNCATLPSLPSAYLRLVEAMNDPYSSAEDFAGIVASDPALTARVLKIVNSPLYRISAPVDTLPQAMSIIGVGTLHDLVLATSAIDVFNNVPAELMNMESFWKHSLATAVVARAIGVACEHRAVEKLFLCGLLHDVGRLVMCLSDPQTSCSVFLRGRGSSDLLFDVERREIGFDHALIGRQLLLEWGLPNTLTEPVGFHHHPDLGREFKLEAAIVHIADLTAHALFFDSSGEHLIPPLSGKAWSLLNWHDHDVHFFADVEKQFHMAQHVILH